MEHIVRAHRCMILAAFLTSAFIWPWDGTSIALGKVLGVSTNEENQIAFRVDFAVCEALIPGYPTAEVARSRFFLMLMPRDVAVHQELLPAQSPMRDSIEIRLKSGEVYAEDRQLSSAAKAVVVEKCRGWIEMRDKTKVPI